MRRLAPTLLTAVVLALLAQGCSQLLTTRISDITADPRRFEGSVVSISGTVRSSANIIVFKVFEVDDGTGKMLVIPKGAVPREGQRVRVTGRVQQAFALGDVSAVVIHEE